MSSASASTVFIFVIRLLCQCIGCLLQMDNGVRASFLISQAGFDIFPTPNVSESSVWARYKSSHPYTQTIHSIVWCTHKSAIHTERHEHTYTAQDSKLYAVVHCWVRMNGCICRFCWTSRAYCVCVDSIQVRTKKSEKKYNHFFSYFMGTIYWLYSGNNVVKCMKITGKSNVSSELSWNRVKKLA